MKMLKTMLYLFVLMLLISSCSLLEPFETYECGEKYLHVYYGGGVGGYRLVVFNRQKSMTFKGADWYEKYKRDNTSKVVFENDNPIAVTCDSKVSFVTDSSPLVNTMDDSVSTKIVAPHELIDVDTTVYHHVIR